MGFWQEFSGLKFPLMLQQTVKKIKINKASEIKITQMISLW
jgi:hypothetical protein